MWYSILELIYLLHIFFRKSCSFTKGYLARQNTVELDMQDDSLGSPMSLPCWHQKVNYHWYPYDGWDLFYIPWHSHRLFPYFSWVHQLPGIHLPRHNGPDASLGGLHDIIIPSSRKAIGHDRRAGSLAATPMSLWNGWQLAAGHEYFSGYGWRTMPKWLINGLIPFIPFMTPVTNGITWMGT